MGLTGAPFLVLVICLALVPLGIAVYRPARLLGLPARRLVAVVVCAQFAGGVAVFVGLNDKLGVYPSWSDLVGRSGPRTAAAAPEVRPLDSAADSLLAKAPKGRGALLDVSFSDLRAGLFSAATYVPAAYRGAGAGLEFPVMEVRDDQFSSGWDPALMSAVDAAIAAGRIPPVVVVVLSPESGASDMLGAFASDVRTQLGTQLRVRSDSNAWGLLDAGTAPSVEPISLAAENRYRQVVFAGSEPSLITAFDDVAQTLSPPLAPPIMNGAQVTPRRADLRG